jgi:hypothetical protein
MRSYRVTCDVDPVCTIPGPVPLSLDLTTVTLVVSVALTDIHAVALPDIPGCTLDGDTIPPTPGIEHAIDMAVSRLAASGTFGERCAVVAVTEIR